MTWWATPQWREYERICGTTPSRVDLLRAAPWSTRVIDLTPDEATLWRAVRKSSHALIHRAERRYLIRREPAREMARFHALHVQAAGRETRPAASWHLMADWVEAGTLLLAGAHEPTGAPVAYAATYVWQGWSYYGHAVALVPDVAHALVWLLMRYAKANGARVFEAGWQGQDYTPKGRAIEFFRRGFGGVDVPAASMVG